MYRYQIVIYYICNDVCKKKKFMVDNSYKLFIISTIINYKYNFLFLS